MIIFILVLALSASADAFLVGISYGIRKVKIPFGSQLIIGVCAFLCAFVSVLCANGILFLIPPSMVKIISSAALFVIGCYFALKAYCANTRPGEPLSLLKFAVKSLNITVSVVRSPAECDIDNSGIIDPGEAFILGLALSADIFGIGLFCGVIGNIIFLFPAFVGIFNILCIYFGNILGLKKTVSGDKFKKIADFTLPAVFIAIAVINLFK